MISALPLGTSKMHSPRFSIAVTDKLSFDLLSAKEVLRDSD